LAQRLFAAGLSLQYLAELQDIASQDVSAGNAAKQIRAGHAKAENAKKRLVVANLRLVVSMQSRRKRRQPPALAVWSRSTRKPATCIVRDQVRVTRVVIAVASGRIINPKTARSQILGGAVMGISMALFEESIPDTTLGKWINHSFGEYHVPAHADIQNIDVIFVDEPDPEVSPLGVKGLGEIGIVAVAAAVANAIYHATGKRVRSLPITVDKLLAA
jgi:CO/xanthine dehydrogenase Mo-binding subunit